MAKLSENRIIGLALGGGAVLGAAHVGVLRALEEQAVTVEYIAGTSIGAFVAVFHAFGKTWQEIADIAGRLKWMDISGVSLSRYGLLSNEKLGELVEEEIGDVGLEEAHIPLALVATDIATGDRVLLNKGSAAKSVMASTCIPGIFTPVEINGRLFVDGGIAENVPVDTVRGLGADFVIGVDLYKYYSSRKPENIFEVILNTFVFTIRTATKLQTTKTDLMISPDLSSFNMIDTDQVPGLIAKGYESAKSALEKSETDWIR